MLHVRCARGNVDDGSALSGIKQDVEVARDRRAERSEIVRRRGTRAPDKDDRVRDDARGPARDGCERRSAGPLNEPQRSSTEVLGISMMLRSISVQSGLPPRAERRE
jgi:hypothetical protein